MVAFVRRFGPAVLGLTSAFVLIPGTAAHAVEPMINMKILLVSDGTPSTEAIANAMDSEGVPYQKVDLTSPGRPIITPGFLADTVGASDRAKFQGVILPNANPFTDQAEMTALVNFEKKFGIRQLSAYVYAYPDVGLNYPEYAGTLDGMTATVVPGGPFPYLAGQVPFEDESPVVGESYGYLATPLPDDPAGGRSFQPLLTAPVPNSATQGVLAGVYTHDGRSEMVVTAAFNQNQKQFQMISHGIISWLTKGVHFGYDRNYFAVHVDDVLGDDTKWDPVNNCTPASDCPPGVPETGIRMTPADVTAAVQWQNTSGFTLDFYYNGGGSALYAAEHGGADPLLTSLKANKARFRWSNHTYTHPFLGCAQDYSVLPWRCATNAQGQIVWTSRATIEDEINRNKQFATQHGLPVDTTELVTGEHSGLFLQPRQPVDNPNLAPALNSTGVKWIGSDASRDPAQRPVGGAFTVPRYPMNIFYNVATVADEVDEYNWIYNSRADGGSGICEDNPATTTCIPPLDPATGWTQHIAPIEVRNALRHVLSGLPWPHYAHQSNLTGDHLLYQVLTGLFSQYGTLFSANTPIVNLRTSAIGAEIRRMRLWQQNMNQVTGYIQNGVVYVAAPDNLDVPLTAPTGTRVPNLLNLGSSPFGSAYAGELSAYQRNALLMPIKLLLP
ncbi:hypothetical protein GCM10009555_054950 [Acrocarpospora macrocephala]|uniref:Uncharacterized protein n=1 Tax=Acrocarpospora macrocephala TaxID=150177 RepID=A0A5M3WN28_9ACTN|nr:hypothetical protein Amac_042840 [Acrocarpospora macrocephala]